MKKEAGKKKKGALNIVIAGAGMYVCGRGTDGYGTIIPAVSEFARTNNVGKVYVAGNTAEGVRLAKAKIEELEAMTGVELSIEYLPQGKDSAVCYADAMRRAGRPACAVISVPDALHKEVAGAAIREGLHTLVVKPLAPTAKDVSELIGLQKKSKVYCAVEFHKRFDCANLKLKDTIEQGLIGDPLYFLAEFSQRKGMPAGIFKKWVASTNVFQYLGIHYVDIIYFATKARPRRAMAAGQKGWLASKGIDAYDSIGAVIEWETAAGKRFVSHILTSWVDPESTSAMSEQRIKVIGTKGRFESDQKRRGITIVSDEKGIEEPNPYFCSAYGGKDGVYYKGYGIDSICQFFRDVVDIEEGALNIDELEGRRPTFRDSMVPTKVLEAVNRSVKNYGEWVDVC